MSRFEGLISGTNVERKHAARGGKLSFGLKLLDAMTDGGIPRRGIVEMAGDPGTGKTQIALKLALEAQRQVPGTSVVFISTEHPFPSGRLLQMEAALKRQHPHDPFVQQHNFADRILVEHVKCVLSLMNCLFQQLPNLLESTPVSLLIIDSMTGPFIGEDDYIGRADTYRLIVKHLQLFQEQYNMAVYVNNQVRCLIDSSGSQTKDKYIPALGLSWSSLVHTRLQLYRNEGKYKRCNVVFGPTIGPAHGVFQIDESGPCDVPDLPLGHMPDMNE
ncbi:spindle-b recombination protein spn-b [Anopheles darlingi]|uniref:RECA_2 domain-containing protein n=1 Tax=Anopheles darlingi TaxID=43151 RepID=W5JJL9_ANODA|nr:DNA repair protein XRCC3-like [Anopheles darlingi]ETN63493.1 spindle-b recombination protein spn-b [Anopheles darlingi]